MWQTGWNYAVGWVRQESASAAALIQAFIALGIAFAWWHWTSAQTGAVMGIVAALLGMFVRSQVTPIHTIKERFAKAGQTAAAPAPGTGGRPAPGTTPGTGPGPAPGTTPGAGPGPARGIRPGTAPGPAPGTMPGTGPGPAPGTMPGTGPGPAPRPIPGSDAGPDFGQQGRWP